MATRIGIGLLGLGRQVGSGTSSFRVRRLKMRCSECAVLVGMRTGSTLGSYRTMLVGGSYRIDPRNIMLVVNEATKVLN